VARRLVTVRPDFVHHASSHAAKTDHARIIGLDRSALPGHTIGMKTAVSIPDEVFDRAERLARHSKKSRSKLFSDALREYVARHAPDEITAAMDRVIEEIDPSTDEFVAAAARRILEKSEW
jgi:metal-responsive CopG/Arc/MetJ family transcriptional regulator